MSWVRFTPSSGMTNLSFVLVEELLSLSKTPFLIPLALPSLRHTPRNTSGYRFPSAPTTCLFVCCTVHQTVMTPFTSRSPKTRTNKDQLLSTHPNSLFLICGDLNCHNASCLGGDTTLTCHSTSAKGFCDSLGPTQSVKFPTWISVNGTPSLLDLVLTNFPANVCCLHLP